jgi:hypothetical protein
MKCKKRINFLIFSLWILSQAIYLGVIVTSQLRASEQWRFYDEYLFGGLLLGTGVLFIMNSPEPSKPQNSIRSQYKPSQIPLRRIVWLTSGTGLVCCILLYYLGGRGLYYNSQYGHFTRSIPPKVELLNEVYQQGDISEKEVVEYVMPLNRPVSVLSKRDREYDKNLIQSLTGVDVIANDHNEKQTVSPTLHIMKETPHEFQVDIINWDGELLALGLHQRFSDFWMMDSKERIEAEHYTLNLKTNAWLLKRTGQDEQRISISIIHQGWQRVYQGMILLIIATSLGILFDLRKSFQSKNQ